VSTTELTLITGVAFAVNGKRARGGACSEATERRSMTYRAEKAYDEGRLEDVHPLLIQTYANKPARWVLQLDGFANTAGDAFIGADENGYGAMGKMDLGLYNAAGSKHIPVRAIIDPNADKEDVLALLRKITDWVEKDFEKLAAGSAARTLDSPVSPGDGPIVRAMEKLDRELEEHKKSKKVSADDPF